MQGCADRPIAWLIAKVRSVETMVGVRGRVLERDQVAALRATEQPTAR